MSPMIAVAVEERRKQIERILQSDTFRASMVLRRLLGFLADKSLAGEADGLKEYTIAIEGLGKPESYDPRSDSTVRVEIGRLRQKLGEYYRSEGREDPLIVEVPKGHFDLRWESSLLPAGRSDTRFLPAAELKSAHLEFVAPLQSSETSMGFRPSRGILIVSGILLASLLWGTVVTTQLAHERATASARAAWTPELAELWRPFLEPRRPLIISVYSPLFIGLPGGGSYREPGLDSWDDVLKSKKISALQGMLGGTGIIPRYFYTGFGDASAAFQLGKLFGATGLDISFGRSSQLSWQELADNNVISVGAPRSFRDTRSALASDLDFDINGRGITNVHPQPGEPTVLLDDPPYKERAAAAPDDGEIYALVTHIPGPLGNGLVRSFVSNHNPGFLAAVQWFTNPSLARNLVGKMRTSSGEMPRFYQVVLRVKYKDSIPTDVSYVMHRALHVSKSPAGRK
jgi:hypothetical protein